MKKIFSLCLVFIILVLVPAFAFAAGSNVEIPKASKAPAIDGKIGSSEWSGSKQININVEDTIVNGSGWSANGLKSNKGVAQLKTYYMWSETGLYIACKATDSIVTFQQSGSRWLKAGDPLNGQDGPQFVFDPLNKKAAGRPDAYIFDFIPASDVDNKGPAIWFEHWMYNGMKKDAGIKVKGNISSDGYNMEILIPWDALRFKGENFEAKEGTKMGFGILFMDFKDAGASLVDLLTNFGNGKNKIEEESAYNTIVLSSNVAGAASTTTSTKSSKSNPKTGDLGILQYVAASMGSGLVLVTVAKKRRKQ